ncbi:MAG: hypothetical protein P4L53_19900 [Candidatus Obscuribacterales bacterium]|nr:hypothetical protein [Candidatus Obscuribacterales bacterium]
MTTQIKRMHLVGQTTGVSIAVLLFGIFNAALAGEMRNEFGLTAPNEISAMLPKTEYRYASPSNDWIQIPKWLTGTWCEYLNAPIETEVDSQVANKGLPGKPSEIRILDFGMKIDKSGTFWQYAGVPWQRQIERSGSIERQTVDLFKQVASLQNGFSILSTAEVVVSDARTGTEKEKFRQKVLSTYLPIADGKIRIHTTTYRYNLDNTLVSRTEQSGSGVRLTEFIPSDSEELERKFQQFLQK